MKGTLTAYLIMLLIIINILASNPLVVVQGSEQNNDEHLADKAKHILLMAEKAVNFTSRRISAIVDRYDLTLPDEASLCLGQAKEAYISAKGEFSRGNYTAAIRLALRAMNMARRALVVVMHIVHEVVEPEGGIHKARGLSVAINRTRAFIDRLERLAEANIANEMLLEAVRANISEARGLLDEAESALRAGDINATAKLLGEARRTISRLMDIVMRYAYAYELKERVRRYLKITINVTSNLFKLVQGLRARLLRLKAIRTLNQTLLPRLITLHNELLNETLSRLTRVEGLLKAGNITQALKQLAMMRANLFKVHLLRGKIHKVEEKVKRLELINSTEGIKERLEELKEELELAKQVLKEELNSTTYAYIEAKLNKTMDILDELSELIETGNLTEAKEKLRELTIVTNQLLREAHPLIEKAKKLAPNFWRRLKSATSEIAAELKELILELKDRVRELEDTAKSLRNKIAQLREGASSRKRRRLRAMECGLEMVLMRLDHILRTLEGLEEELGENTVKLIAVKARIEGIGREIQLIASVIAEFAEEIEEMGLS